MTLWPLLTAALFPLAIAAILVLTVGEEITSAEEVAANASQFLELVENPGTKLVLFSNCARPGE